MMFIDQTIVALAVPALQSDLSLSATGAQWIINGYLLALAALFALGGKLADVLGHRRMVTIGVIGFAICSALCGATPTGEHRRGVDHRLPRPPGRLRRAAVPRRARDRRRRLPACASAARRWRSSSASPAALTAVGPLAGGYLTEWTWRAIFWINIPVAIVALVLTARRSRRRTRRTSPIDYRGAVLDLGRDGPRRPRPPAVRVWGWADARTLGCDRRRPRSCSPRSSRSSCAGPIRWSSCGSSPTARFAVDNLVLLLMSAVFVPFFFFASVYAQAALGYSATRGRTVPARVLRRLRDRRPVGRADPRQARRQAGRSSSDACCPRSASTCGARSCTDLEFLRPVVLPSRWPAPGSASCSARSARMRSTGAADTSYGEVTGHHPDRPQPRRQPRSGGHGLAVRQPERRPRRDDAHRPGVPAAEADRIAHSVTSRPAVRRRRPAAQPRRRSPDAVRLDIAHSTQTVVWIMAGIMAVAWLVAHVGLRKGRVVEDEQVADAEPELTHA